MKQPTGGSGYHAASPWVGIDGRSCDSAILQAGLDISVGKHGEDYHGKYSLYVISYTDSRRVQHGMSGSHTTRMTSPVLPSKKVTR